MAEQPLNSDAALIIDDLGKQRFVEVINKHQLRLGENTESNIELLDLSDSPPTTELTESSILLNQCCLLLGMSDFVYRSAYRYKDVFYILVGLLNSKPNIANASDSTSTSELKSEFTASNPHILDSLPSFTLSEVVSWPFETDEWLSLSEAEALKQLRLHRHTVMTVIASMHLLKVWDIKQVMFELSLLADEFYGLARAWAIAQLKARFGEALDKNGETVPLISLGMGKLGGMELNFSSDIDLIFCYPKKGTTSGGRKEEDFQSYFTRLAQKIIYLLDTVTADGQVYRVDMRLRPFGDSGPLVSSFDALEDYYQEQGRDWERYALLKARPLVSPLISDKQERGYHDELEELLRPFVYRRYIDYSVIESLRKMKQQIRLEVKRRQLTYNIKLGEGGIREAEFIIQAMQMLRGGKEPQLQTPSFMQVLPELVHLGVFSELEGQEIATAYLFLRDTEQLLQAFDDKQTQTLPTASEFEEGLLDQSRLIHFYGTSDWSGFIDKINEQCRVIHDIFNDVIGDDPDGEQQVEDSIVVEWQSLWNNKNLDLKNIEVALNDVNANSDHVHLDSLHPDTLHSDSFHSELAHLAEPDSDKSHEEQDHKGLSHRVELIKQMVDLRPDLLKSVISSKGRDKLDILIPLLLAEGELQKVGSKQMNDLLLIIKKIASRTTYLSLLIENPGALTQLVKLVSCCDFIGQQLKAFPMLLDQLIDPKLLYTKPNTQDYATDLRRNLLRVAPDDLELQMEILRQFKLSSQLIVAACDVEGVIDLATESNLLTALAEAILSQVVNLAWRQMIERYGYPADANDEHKNFAVIGYGKLGGYELGYGSDLDIVFVHGCRSSEATDGKKPIDSRQFYLKLAQRILHIFTTRTPSGVLYEIDTRLRPSGASGLMAINIDTFYEYQQQEAWTWEHQALVRARLVLGEPLLMDKFADIRNNIISTPRDTSVLIDEISNMRQKMFDNLAKEHNGQFDLKQSRGGIADIEFITQYLVLRYGRSHDELKEFSDNKRLLKVAEQYDLLIDNEAQLLWAAYEAYRDLVHDASLNLQPTQVPFETVKTHAQNVIGVWKRLGLG